MIIALRVLTGVIEKRSPDQSDVQILREIAPELAERPVDELASRVIQIFHAKTSMTAG